MNVHTRKAAIYCRISKDVLGDELGVTRQERDCRELVDGRGWTFARLYVDDDLSAFDGTARPGYARLLEDLRLGDADAVVAWHPDRLHRSPRELEDFIDLIERTGAAVATVTAGEYDLATPSGRTVARIVGAVARGESEHKSERIRRKHRELAERGRWQGGPRPYGYDLPRDEHGAVVRGTGDLVVVPDEAEIIREAARRILAGESVYAICSDLNARAVPTVRGAKWRTPSLRSILTTAKVAGKREHHGEVIGDATWEPILDEETWRRVRAIICDPTRAKGARPGRRTYLLSGGIARCGRCGEPLHARRRQRPAPGVEGARLYACVKSTDKDGCGGLQIRAGGLENLVVEAVLLRLDSPELARAIAALGAEADDDLAAELVEIEERLAALAADYGTGDLDRAEWAAARAPLKARREEARRRQARAAKTWALEPYLGQEGALRAAWPDLTLDQRRAVLAAVLEAVVVRSAVRLGPGLDPARVDLRWRV